MKKERTRNLLPAKVGIYGILIFLGHTIIWQLAFSLKVWLQQWMNTRLSM